MQEARQKPVDTLLPISTGETRVRSELNDPYVIGATALILGYAVGVGRWAWLSREVGKVLTDLGSLAMVHVRQAVQQKNSEFLRATSASSKT